MRMHADEVDIDADLVGRLVASQFPELGDLAVTLVEPWGTDNAIWRLGSDLVVRLPRIESSVAQVGFEADWLPRIASELSVAIPEPVATGHPDDDFPFPWAIHRWLPGTTGGPESIPDRSAFAVELARVTAEIHALDTTGLRPALNRAQPIATYDRHTRATIRSVSHLIDTDAATAIWDEALAARPHSGEPLWVHGDLEGNTLVDGRGHLTGLIDWGLACAGDPAVDIAVVWSTLFDDTSRAVFLDLLDVDDHTIARSRGAGIYQACGALGYYFDTYPLIVERAWHKLAQLGVSPRQG